MKTESRQIFRRANKVFDRRNNNELLGQIERRIVYGLNVGSVAPPEGRANETVKEAKDVLSRDSKAASVEKYYDKLGYASYDWVKDIIHSNK